MVDISKISNGTTTYDIKDAEARNSIANLSNVATTGDYNDLTNKPTIPTVNNATLTIQKNGTNVATFTANASSNVTANISVPNTVSSVSSSSTNADAVGAKLFYDTVGDIETALHTINSGGSEMVNLSWSYDYIYSASYSIKVNDETVASSGSSSISETLIGSYAVGSEVKVTFGVGEPINGKIQLYVNNVLTEELTIITTKTYTFLLEEETVIRIVYQDEDIGPVEPV